MAIADKLKKYVTAIADAIRAKEGSTESINPQDFAERIQNLSGGGGTSESNIEYIDVRELGELKAPLIMYALAVRMEGAEKYTMPITSLLISSDNVESVFNRVKAVMLDLSFVLDLGSDGKFETRELFATMGIDLSSLPRLTKEQFYTLE